MTAPPPAMYVTEGGVTARYGIARATWRRWVAGGYAPQPVHLGPRLVRWLAADLEAFEARLAADRSRPASPNGANPAEVKP